MSSPGSVIVASDRPLLQHRAGRRDGRRGALFSCVRPPARRSLRAPMRTRRATLVLSAMAVLVAAAAGVATAAGKPGYPDRISWAGRTWQVKSSQSKVGPGPNYFSASAENVWVDGL